VQAGKEMLLSVSAGRKGDASIRQCRKGGAGTDNYDLTSKVIISHSQEGKGDIL
jgi:hypothetical protein